MGTPRVRKTRASSSDEARRYRQKGHDDALLFAIAIGLDRDYKNDIKAKKDVIDPSGDSHSVKSGEKKWQIFLYGLNRFETDVSFRVMNGIGDLLMACIKSFPETYEKYVANKAEAKEKLRPHMVSLAKKLQDKNRLMAFIDKAMFNGGEVNYLTVLHGGKFHVFWGKEVEYVIANNVEVANSQARQAGQFEEQKVIFKFEGTNLAELEMRNDSPQLIIAKLGLIWLSQKPYNCFFQTSLRRKNIMKKLFCMVKQSDILDGGNKKYNKSCQRKT